MCPRAIYVQRASPVLCLRLQRSAFANNKILLLSRGIWAPCEYGRLPSHVIFDHVIRKKITWWLKNKTIITTKDATSPVAVIPFHTRHLKYNEYSYTTIFFFCFFLVVTLFILLIKRWTEQKQKTISSRELRMTQ